MPIPALTPHHSHESYSSTHSSGFITHHITSSQPIIIIIKHHKIFIREWNIDLNPFQHLSKIISDRFFNKFFDRFLIDFLHGGWVSDIVSLQLRHVLCITFLLILINRQTELDQSSVREREKLFEVEVSENWVGKRWFKMVLGVISPVGGRERVIEV